MVVPYSHRMAAFSLPNVYFGKNLCMAQHAADTAEDDAANTIFPNIGKQLALPRLRCSSFVASLFSRNTCQDPGKRREYKLGRPWESSKRPLSADKMVYIDIHKASKVSPSNNSPHQS